MILTHRRLKKAWGSDYKVSNIGEVGRILGDSDGENTELILLVYTKMYKKMLTKNILRQMFGYMLIRLRKAGIRKYLKIRINVNNNLYDLRKIMRIKREVLILIVLPILFMLFQIMTNIGGEFYDKGDLLQVISYFVPVWVGFFIIKLKQNNLIWIFIVLFSAVFGLLEAYILNNPSDFIVRLVGWPIATFIIMIWTKNSFYKK